MDKVGGRTLQASVIQSSCDSGYRVCFEQAGSGYRGWIIERGATSKRKDLRVFTGKTISEVLGKMRENDLYKDGSAIQE